MVYLCGKHWRELGEACPHSPFMMQERGAWVQYGCKGELKGAFTGMGDPCMGFFQWRYPFGG